MKKTQTPLFSGVLNCLLGLLFIFLAVQQVNKAGWGFFAYFFVIIATIDLGIGFRLLSLHFKIKKQEKKK